MPRYATDEELAERFTSTHRIGTPVAGTGDYFGASVDSLQSNLAAIPAAMGSDYFNDLRLSNKVEADQTRERYFQTNPDAARGLRDVNLGNVAGLFGRTTLDSLPTMGGIAAAGLVGGLPGAVAVGSIMGTGDVLSNQYDEAGRGDLTTAAPLGLAYGAVDALTGIGGSIIRRGLTKTGIRALDNLGADKLAGLGGWGGTAARTAAGGAKGFVAEGAGETFQEGMNQLGRMAVNENQTLFNEDANDRYLESFILGGAMGGVVSGAGGLMSGQSRKPVDEGNKDLLGEQAPPADERPAFDLQSYDQSQGPMARTGQSAPPLHVQREQLLDELATVPEWDTETRSEYLRTLAEVESEMRGGVIPVQDGQRSLMADVYEMVNGQPTQLTNDEAVQGLMPFAPPGDTNNWTTTPGAGAPTQGGLDFSFTEDVGNVVKQETPEQKLAREVGESNAAAQAKFAETKTRAATALQKPDVKPQEVNTYAKLEQAVAEGLITQERMSELVANLTNKTDTPRSIEKYLTGIAEMKAAEANAQQTELATSLAKVQNGKSKSPVRLGTPGNNTGASQPASATKAKAPAVPAAKPAVTSGSTPAVTQNNGAVAGLDPNKTVAVGRKGRETSVTPGQLMQKMSNASGIDKARIVAATGLDVVLDPTTGAPRFVQSTDEPATLEQIAEAESKATGKRVTREAIRLSLLKYGITPEVVTQMQSVADANTFTEADLGIDKEENGSGFRIETDMSKATGQGLVDDGNTQTKAQRELGQQADELLKEAGPSTAVGAVEDAPPTNLPPGAVVTDLREQNPETISANIRRILESEAFIPAAADWPGERYTIDQLPDTLKADWLEEYEKVLNQYNNDWNEYVEAAHKAAADRIERDADRLTGGVQTTTKLGQTTGVEVRTTRPGVRSGQSSPVVAGPKGSGPTVRAEGAQAGNGKKTLSLSKPEATEQKQSRKLQSADTAEVKTLKDKIDRYSKLLACLTK